MSESNMSNVSSLTDSKLVGRPYGDAGVNIVSSTLYSQWGQVPGLAWYEEESGTYVAKTSEKYKPTQYPESIDAIRRVLDNGDFNTTAIQESIQVSENFAMMAATYKLPEVNFKSPDGDTACLSVGVITSFDGTWKFEMMASGVLGFCLNSQVFLRNPIALYAARHSAKLDIETGVRQVGLGIERMRNEVELWHELYGTPVSDEQADRLFIDSLEIQDRHYATADEVRHALFMGKTRLNGNSIVNKNLEYLRTVYAGDYVRRMGRNRWSVYNALTDWRTHAPARDKANVIKLDVKRSKIITEVVSRNWGIAA